MIDEYTIFYFKLSLTEGILPLTVTSCSKPRNMYFVHCRQLVKIAYVVVERQHTTSR
jgi:hypothetical protein